ncbi:MAG: DegV family protein [Oscillospiraceae bacterium]|nr:DegV family protein [Oscillospiraceae bacterium]
MSYKIITDSCCDMSQQMYADLDLTVVALNVTIKDETINQYTEERLKEIYAALREKEHATTAAANPQDWEDAIAPVLEQGMDALVLAFSSGLSTTYQSAVIAAEELMERYPGRTVKVVDTLCASMGQGLLAYYACKKRDAGFSLEDLTAWCEENKHHIAHWVTVDDLFHLKRGGRVSAATAVAGTMLQIKPIIHVDEEGRLVNVGKARGRKAALQTLAKKMADTQIVGANDTIFISHGDCIEDAEALAEMLKEQCGVKEVVIHYIGAVIGSHAGPGTVALFFLANER